MNTQADKADADSWAKIQVKLLVSKAAMEAAHVRYWLSELADMKAEQRNST